MHYLDKTFCSAYNVDCRNGRCHRAMTPSVYADIVHDAVQWWDGEPPIAYMDMSKDCKDKIEL